MLIRNQTLKDLTSHISKNTDRLLHTSKGEETRKEKLANLIISKILNTPRIQRSPIVRDSYEEVKKSKSPSAKKFKLIKNVKLK